MQTIAQEFYRYPPYGDPLNYAIGCYRNPAPRVKEVTKGTSTAVGRRLGQRPIRRRDP